VTDAEILARLKAFCARALTYGKPGPRPQYDPGAPPLPSLPKPPEGAPPPPQSHHDREPGEDDE